MEMVGGTLSKSPLSKTIGDKQHVGVLPTLSCTGIKYEQPLMAYRVRREMKNLVVERIRAEPSRPQIPSLPAPP